jgi:tetratricopeptide (TPR) repeat protein
MVTTIAPLVLLACLAGTPAAPPGPVVTRQHVGQEARSERVKSGARHFDRAFYELTPHKRDDEASREFDLAIADFEAELRAAPASVEAHTYLGRILSLRQQHRQAAGHYDELRALEPDSPDACVLSALAWTEAGETAIARERLLEAKGRTTDPHALGTLDEYLAKLDAHERGRGK